MINIDPRTPSNLISIVIVNWNTTDYLIECLHSIYGNPPVTNFEVIVVDNASEDHPVRIKAAYPIVRLIRCSFNYGFGLATNIGCRFASGNYLMTLNPDTVVNPEMIDQLVNCLDKDATVGIAAPVLEGQRVTRSQYSPTHLFINSIVLRKCRKFTKSVEPELNQQFDVDFLGGTGYICRASLLEVGRLFSEDTFLFGEEYEICRRVALRGYRIRVVPSARFEHHTSVTFKNDTAKLSMVSKLGTAVGWQKRKEYYGKFVGTLTGVMLSVEIAFKWILQKIQTILRRAPDDRMARMLRQSESIFLASVSMFLHAEDYLEDVNKKAANFFNDGRTPEYPPQYTEIILEKEALNQ